MYIWKRRKILYNLDISLKDKDNSQCPKQSIWQYVSSKWYFPFQLPWKDCFYAIVVFLGQYILPFYRVGYTHIIVHVVWCIGPNRIRSHNADWLRNEFESDIDQIWPYQIRLKSENMIPNLTQIYRLYPFYLPYPYPAKIVITHIPSELNPIDSNNITFNIKIDLK